MNKMIKFFGELLQDTRGNEGAGSDQQVFNAGNMIKTGCIVTTVAASGVYITNSVCKSGEGMANATTSPGAGASQVQGQSAAQAPFSNQAAH